MKGEPDNANMGFEVDYEEPWDVGEEDKQSVFLFVIRRLRKKIAAELHDSKYQSTLMHHNSCTHIL